MKPSFNIRLVQKKDVFETDQLLDSGIAIKLYPLIPKFIRKRIIRRMILNPFNVKKQGGLIVVTSVGMFANTRGWIGGFGGITTLNFAVGGISRNLTKIGESLHEEQLLQLTLSFDHDIIDGGPATRFSSNLIELIENAHGLTDLI